MKQLKIGNVLLENSYVLGPMAGVTDLPFRLLCKEQGAGLLCMEMVSAKGIFYNNKNTESLLQIHPEEVPVSLQFFGRIRRSSARWRNGSRNVRFPFWISTWDVRCQRSCETEKGLH